MPDLGYLIQGAANGSITNAVYCPLVMPEDGTLASISMYVGIDFGAGRAGLYSGGTSVDDPTGATLVEDFALIPNGQGWQTMPSSTTAALTTGVRYWLSVKSNDGASFRIARDAGTLGNFAGDGVQSTGETADETVAWSATVPAGTLTQLTNTYSMYLTYTTGGGVEEIVLPGYSTPQFTQLLFNTSSLNAIFTGHLISGSSTSPLLSGSKDYFADIEADELSNYTPQVLSGVSASVESGNIKLVCEDILFADASASQVPIEALVIVANVTNSSNSPYCLLNLSGALAANRTPNDEGIEFTGLDTYGFFIMSGTL